MEAPEVDTARKPVMKAEEPDPEGGSKAEEVGSLLAEPSLPPLPKATACVGSPGLKPSVEEDEDAEPDSGSY